jgi:hypothetical protein
MLIDEYARVIDHLAVQNVAEGASLGGGSTLHPLLDKYVVFYLSIDQ